MAIAANMAKLGVSTFQCPGRETLPSYSSLLSGEFAKSPRKLPFVSHETKLVHKPIPEPITGKGEEVALRQFGPTLKAQGLQRGRVKT